MEDNNVRRKHVEVCVRIRPLVVGKESSTSFFVENQPTSNGGGGSSKLYNKSSNNSSSSNNNNHHHAAQHVANSKSSSSSLVMSQRPSRMTPTGLRKPQIPRSGALLPGSTMTHRTLGGGSPQYKGPPRPDTPTSQPLEEADAATAASTVTAASTTTYAWDVVSSDTVRQSPETFIVPGRTHTYTLDRVYGPDSTTRQLYQHSVKDLVHAAMDGYHAAVLAYGQTSTGKTHTMTGTPSQPGLVPLAVRECFEYLQQRQDAREYLLRVSYLEVYKEHIRDLLAPPAHQAPTTPIRLFDSADKGLCIKGLREEVVTSPDQVFALLSLGESRRQMGATMLNQHSSRSHVMVRLWIESRSCSGNSAATSSSTLSSATEAGTASRNMGGVRVSSLSLVDLAGSESVRLTGSNERREEGHYINKSLMTLGQVVYALSDQPPDDGENGNNMKGLKHVPYRDSKLTRLLQPSLSGNAQVVLICCISPLVTHLEESHNTFKFATRAKKIPQKATIQEAVDEKTLLQSYREEIEDLKQQLKEAREQQEVLKTGAGGGGNNAGSSNDLTMASSEDEVQELVEAIQTMERLILKSNKPASLNFQRPEDLLDSSDGEDDYDDEESLLAMVGENNSVMTPLKGSMNGGALTSPYRDGSASTRDLQVELARIQGLLGSVLKKRMTAGRPPGQTASPYNSTISEAEVRNLRAQLEEQEVTTSLRKADSSFLQAQLEEKDNLLQEVSKLLEAVEVRQAKLEAENEALRREIITLRNGQQL